MKTLIFFLPIYFLSLISFSQVDKIEMIKKLYYEINQDNYLSHDITIKTILPAVGEKTKTLRLFYSAEQTDPETDPYEMEYTLYKAEIKYNISASSFLSFEYLFNKNGELIFHFDKEEGIYDNHEKRYYYDKGKLIMCKIKIDNEDGSKRDYTNKQAFTQVDLKEADNGTSKAANYLSFFKQVVLLDMID